MGRKQTQKTVPDETKGAAEALADPAALPLNSNQDSQQNADPESATVESAIKAALSQEGAKGDAAQTPPAGASKRVEVLFAGRLGPKLLTKGDITDDPDYVKLLDTRPGLVREV